ncbi:MAG: electron transport complex subunit RsxC [Spirochaetaceae bacterium]|nr:MAG: electron transport complex subunit RsxC [Spirochaetaceae bacterium]
MFSTKTFRGGIHPPGKKEATKEKWIVVLPMPQKVVIPLQQHTGKRCDPTVAVGDTVTAGQEIGAASGFISAPVHASISGKVTAIEELPHPVLGNGVLSIVIENVEGASSAEQWEADPSWEKLSPKELKEKIQKAGIVGMGGAAFPTHVKLSPPEGTNIDAVVLNGAECEPYLTTDYRIMIEKADEVLTGLSIILKVLGCKTAFIAIEKNKPTAISLLQERLLRLRATLFPADDFRIEVLPLKVKYPQGAEKQLIKAVVNTEVPSGGLPFNVGIIVQNVGTAFAIYEAVVKNKPLIERVVTVSGEGIEQPQNFLVRLGTPFSRVIEAAGGMKRVDTPHKILMGGPMMGLAQYNMEVPVVKGTSGILVLPDQKKKAQRACIKCGKCVDHCPMMLLPSRIADFAERDDFVSCREFSVTDCCECGVCTFLCPSGRPIVHLVKYAKMHLLKNK